MENPNSKENTIAIDFDGTIMAEEKISTAFTDQPLITEPIEGALRTIRDLNDLGYRIVIFSCRATDLSGRKQIEDWLKDHQVRSYVSEITAIKPFAYAYVDDRAIKFRDWESARVEMMLMELK